MSRLARAILQFELDVIEADIKIGARVSDPIQDPETGRMHASAMAFVLHLEKDAPEYQATRLYRELRRIIEQAEMKERYWANPGKQPRKGI